METQHNITDPAALYAESVDREREAWHALQAHPPGEPGREAAWKTWSEAILRTNLAWRRVSARHFADPARHGLPQPANHHAST